MNLILICIALLVLLVFVLGFWVSVNRRRAGIGVGHPAEGDHPLTKAVRAHGNTAEYVPVLVVLFYVLAQVNPATWVVACIVIVTACRFSIVYGLLACKTVGRSNRFRFMGALGTYIFGAILSVALLASVVSRWAI